MHREPRYANKRHIRSENVDVIPYYFSTKLTEKLETLALAKATVIEAPSGYGKTTAMRYCLKSFAKSCDKVYWFTAVDEAPLALYRRFCREIEKIDGRAGSRLRNIDFPNAFTIGEVCAALRSVECSTKTWLVIDNFQYLFKVLPASFLSALLDHDTDALNLVVVTQPLGQAIFSAITCRGIHHITATDLKWENRDIRSYFRYAGVAITEAAANDVRKYTDGWAIAVHLQLCKWRETGSFSGDAILLLMEHLIWNKMTTEQQEFFLYLSPFETCTIKRMCSILNCETMPDYAMDSLSIPFIRYTAESQSYEPHSILLDMVRLKRLERGEDYDRSCLIKAGDICKEEGSAAEAMAFYAKINDYDRMLSLEMTTQMYMEIGDVAFFDIAEDIAKNCPSDVKRKNPHSILCVAWAIRQMGNEDEYARLLQELDETLPETGLLRAEWLLLSAYLHFPKLEKMISIVQKASAMFDNSCSCVILQEAPWAFYEHVQMAAFHIETGAADREAAMLEEFINIYSNLTGGHGKGADTLFCAELAFYRGETAKAEILAHSAIFTAESSHQKVIQIGAARLLAAIAILKADAPGWQQAISTMENAASGAAQNTAVFRAFLDVVRNTVFAELSDYSRIADWLQKVDFMTSKLPASIINNGKTVHSLAMMGKGDFAKLIGQGQSISTEKYTLIPEHIHFLFLAVSYFGLGDRSTAAQLLKHSVEKIMADGMFHYIASFSATLDGIPDDLVKSSYPHLFMQYIEYKDCYTSNWCSLHKAIVADDLPTGLTGREREVADLAAEGLRNYEIANMLFLSENTVRAHLRAIYQKLDIDCRAKLAKKLNSGGRQMV